MDGRRVLVAFKIAGGRKIGSRRGEDINRRSRHQRESRSFIGPAMTLVGKQASCRAADLNVGQLLRQNT